MTWYAHEIILPATERAVARIRGDAMLRPFAYHVTSLPDVPWYKPEYVHGLPPGGLLVVWPVTDATSHAATDWYDEATLEWHAPVASAPDERWLDPAAERGLEAYVDREHEMPPRSLRLFMAELAVQAGVPAMYYACDMWGGDVCSEYSLVYTPGEALHKLDRDQGNHALRQGLAALGLQLPSHYFALHARDFPWARYRLGG